jgi:hypothetical protein
VATDLELSTSRLYKLNLSLSLEHHDSDVAVWPGSRPEPGGQPGLAGRHAMSLWQKLRRGVRNEHWMLDEGVRVGSSTLIIESGTTGMTAAAAADARASGKWPDSEPVRIQVTVASEDSNDLFDCGHGTAAIGLGQAPSHRPN